MYRVILICNGEYRKTFKRSKTIETAYHHFHKLKNENQVYYPKKFINCGTIKPAKYEICVSKVTEEGDTFRLLRDEFGKTYTEKPLGDWTILCSEEYLIEETFWMYDTDPKKIKDRPTIKGILKVLVDGAYKKNMVKNIIILRNKLVIYNEDLFDMVVCKNDEDCKRLHHTLARLARKQKLKNLLFMGVASKTISSSIYKMIMEVTGWPYHKVKRTTTRH